MILGNEAPTKTYQLESYVLPTSDQPRDIGSGCGVWWPDIAPLFWSYPQLAKVPLEYNACCLVNDIDNRASLLKNLPVGARE